jgi:hypothetical protein
MINRSNWFIIKYFSPPNLTFCCAADVVLCIFSKAGIGTYDTDGDPTGFMSAFRKVFLQTCFKFSCFIFILIYSDLR